MFSSSLPQWDSLLTVVYDQNQYFSAGPCCGLNIHDPGRFRCRNKTPKVMLLRGGIWGFNKIMKVLSPKMGLKQS